MTTMDPQWKDQESGPPAAGVGVEPKPEPPAEVPPQGAPDPVPDVAVTDETKSYPAVETPPETPAVDVNKAKEEIDKALEGAKAQAAEALAKAQAEAEAKAERERLAELGPPVAESNRDDDNPLMRTVKNLAEEYLSTDFKRAAEDVDKTMTAFRKAIMDLSNNRVTIKGNRLQDASPKGVTYQIELVSNHSNVDFSSFRLMSILIPWAEGYPITVTPGHSSVHRKPCKINDKNELFIWLNKEFKDPTSALVLRLLLYSQQAEIP